MAAIIQASRRKCLVLRVTVKRAENVVFGYWTDLADTPDPFVVVHLPLSPNGRRKTKTVNNNKNPTWDETFEFYLDPELDNVMNVTLMEDDIAFDDQIGQTLSFTFKELDLDLDGQEKDFKVTFNQVSHVFMELHLYTYTGVLEGVRFSTNICDEEISFRSKRKQFVFHAMQAVLGERGPKNVNEVPTVAILGSGGGFRAMVALSGTTCALKDLGIFDCSMYMAVLSGSAWYTSTLYSHPNWPKIHPVEVNNEMRKNVEKNWVRLLFTPSWLRMRISAIWEKKKRGQPVSFTDLFGYLIGDTLLANRKKPVLSDQKNTIKDASVPMPLYACAHVKKDVNAEDFNEWVELNPYEIGMLKYGTFLTPEEFGNKYFCGVCVTEYPEPPLHFVQGFCGSAFTVLIQRIMNAPNDPDEVMEGMKKVRDDGQTTMKEHMKSSSIDHVDNKDQVDDEDSGDENTDDEPSKDEEEVDDESTKDKIINYIVNKFSFLKTREGRAAEIHNFLRGLDIAINPKDFTDYPHEDHVAVMKRTTDSKYKRMLVCDAGLVFNSPYPLILRKERQVDLILSFDYSAREKDVSPPFEELIKAAQWAKYHHYPFPPINHEEQYEKYGLREYYVFKDDKDPNCPIVIHFPLVNNLFHTYKAPGVPRVTLEEVEAGKMPIFEDPENSYSTFNFHYLNKPFDRLVELTNFNAKVCNDVICDVMAECVARKCQNNNTK